MKIKLLYSCPTSKGNDSCLMITFEKHESAKRKER